MQTTRLYYLHLNVFLVSIYYLLGFYYCCHTIIPYVYIKLLNIFSDVISCVCFFCFKICNRHIFMISLCVSSYHEFFFVCLWKYHRWLIISSLLQSTCFHYFHINVCLLIFIYLVPGFYLVPGLLFLCIYAASHFFTHWSTVFSVILLVFWMICSSHPFFFQMFNRSDL